MACPVQRHRWIRGGRAAMVLLGANLLIGCVATSWDRVAPPVDVLAAGGMADVPGQRAALERGRMVYLVDCSSCHVPEPILAHSREDWKHILPEMIEETTLTAAEEADLRLYVESVLQLGVAD
jgi:mono/diheme cytochrome c family protein